jgi:hypothetical protein
MKKLLILPVLLILIQGCAPKLGKDIIVGVDPKNTKIETSTIELTTNLVSFLGANTSKTPIKISGFLNIENHWWKSFEVKTISYEMLQDDEVIAKGNAKIEGSVTVDSGEKKHIPLVFIIDTKSLTSAKMAKRLMNKDNLELQGTVVVSVLGKDIESKFKNKLNK